MRPYSAILHVHIHISQQDELVRQDIEGARDTDKVHDGEVHTRELEVVRLGVAEDVVRLADDSRDGNRYECDAMRHERQST